MHLSAGQLVDLAEGTRPESSAPHLASCEACRAQLAELRAMIAAAADADVPEPSPLFWDRLSMRVHEAVDGERAADARLTPSRHVLLTHVLTRLPIAPLAAAAVLAIVVLLIAKTPAPAPSGAFDAPPAAAADPIVPSELFDNGRDDVWLTFVADLAAAAGADAVRDEGLDALNADEAVMHLTDAELRELERLLQTQIRSQGGLM
jgi:hypothetical protein